MKFKILKALVKKDALALDQELFGYDKTIAKVIDMLAWADEREELTATGLSNVIYDEIAKGILGGEYGEG